MVIKTNRNINPKIQEKHLSFSLNRFLPRKYEYVDKYIIPKITPKRVLFNKKMFKTVIRNIVAKIGRNLIFFIYSYKVILTNNCRL